MAKNMKSVEDWKLVGTDSLPPEYCPDVVTEFTLRSSDTPVNRIPRSLFDRLRKHLLSLGWTIEYMSSQDSVDYRYTSLDGEMMRSLSEACHKLRQSPTKKDSVVRPNMLLATQENYSDGDCSADEPEYCPEAIVYWYRNGLDKKNKNSDMKLKAKNHLLAMSWSIWRQYRKDRTELRYTSPEGKTYYSLRMACKGFIEGGGIPQTILSRENLSSLRNEECPVPFQTEESLPEDSARKRRRVDETCAGESQDDKEVSPRRRKVMKTLMNSRSDETCAGESQDDKEVSLRRRKVMKTLMNSRSDQNVVQPTTTAAVERSSRAARRVSQSALSHLIESNVILPRARVRYGRKDAPLAQGCITCDGIECDCCHQVFQLSAFEVHAGSKNHRPAANIFLEDGRSIADCQRQVDNEMGSGSSKPRELRKRKRNGVAQSYDFCAVCSIGGELIICEQCPAGYHQDCLGLDSIPEGKWYCPGCCCGICGKGEFEHTTEHSLDDNGTLICHQCEHKFHLGCIKESQGSVKLQKDDQEKWFCSPSCHKVFSALQELSRKPISVGSNGLTWRLLQFTKKSGKRGDPNGSIDSETTKKTKIKLRAALEVMHECFESMTDPLTGKDLVADVIFNSGSKKRHLNFKGFYTAVLERKTSLITAATVRVFGKIAEIPLVATRFRHRNCGLGRLMMSELERQLMAIGVKKLILPSSPSVVDTWTTKFGYSKVTDSEKLDLLKHNFLNFSDTIMCQKQLM